MDNAQRFLNAFAMIEKQLKQITGVTRYSRFYQLLNQASRISALTRDISSRFPSTRLSRTLRSWRGKSANRRRSARIFSSR